MKGAIGSRLRRATVIAGVCTIALGGVVLGTSKAYAVGGTHLGAITITPDGEGTSTGATITYSASACDTGSSSSAQVRLIDPNGNNAGNLSPVNNTAGVPFTGSFNAGALATLVGADAAAQGATDEIAVFCSSAAGLTGTTSDYDQFIYIPVAAGGATFGTPGEPSVPVTVTLTAAPTTGTVGQLVTLTAQTNPVTATGSIEFEDTATSPAAILATVPLNGTTGTALTSFTPSAASTGMPLKAVYVTNENFIFSDTATDAISLVVNAAAPNSGAIPLAVVVPATGVFTVTIDLNDWVQLIVADPSNPLLATANTTPIVVVDDRNIYPGWSVSGLVTQFSGTIPSTPPGFPTFTNPATVPADHGTQTIAANQLGWVPNAPSPAVPGLTPGATVAPVTTGLGTAAILASVHAGTGNGFTGTTGTTLSAALTLAIPPNQEAGPYAGFMYITAVDALP